MHQSLAAQLELPQVRVEIERIELRLTARLEQCGEPLDVVGEDLLGDLPTAGELGPVPGVGGRGDDRRVHSRGRHACEQHRRAPGQAREGGIDDRAAVGQHCQSRCVTVPGAGHVGHAAGCEQVALTAAQRRGMTPRRYRGPETTTAG